MDQSESTAAYPVRRSRRRWFQFSLRGFLVVLTIGCLWLGWKVERAQSQREAVAKIESVGAIVYYGDSTAPVEGLMTIGSETVGS